MRQNVGHRITLSINKTKLLTGLLILSVALGGYGFACKTGDPQVDDKLRTLIRTEDDIAQGLKSTANVLKSSKETGALSQEDLDFLKPILKTVGESHLQAIKITKSINAKGELSLDNQAQLLEIISFASDQIVMLNNEGVLRIKNPQKRLLFTTIVLTLQSSVTSIVPLLTKGK